MADPRKYDANGDVTEGYITPEETNALGLKWAGRPGEPDDLSDSYHYQTPDESHALGRVFETQPAILEGRATHAGFAGGRPGVDPGRPSLASLLQPDAAIGGPASMLAKYGAATPMVIGIGPDGQPVYGSAPVSTTMPVGGRPQLSSLLRSR